MPQTSDSQALHADHRHALVLAAVVVVKITPDSLVIGNSSLLVVAAVCNMLGATEDVESTTTVVGGVERTTLLDGSERVAALGAGVTDARAAGVGAPEAVDFIVTGCCCSVVVVVVAVLENCLKVVELVDFWFVRSLVIDVIVVVAVIGAAVVLTSVGVA